MLEYGNIRDLARLCHPGYTLTFCLKCRKCDTMVAQRLLRDVFRSSVLLSIVSETELA